MRTLALTVAMSATLLGCQRASDAPPSPAPFAPTPSPGVAPQPVGPAVHDAPDAASSRMYTTYFYTAGEAVIHGYAADTHARIVALSDPGTDRKAGTIWEGTVATGEAKTVTTGAGVFGLLSDKKAAILVGTPSSCAVVGYFVKDDEGRFLTRHVYTQLPAQAQLGGERVIVWASDAAQVTVRVPATQKILATKTLAAGGRLELDRATIATLGNQVIEITSTGAAVSTEVYYDQGFIVPARTGRGTGTDFYAFVGALTAGSNDLDVVPIDHDALVHIVDVDTGAPIWDGKVPAGGIHATSLANRYVRVTSDEEIEVMVAAYEHDAPGYAEHHFATGRQGGGIDSDFELTTSQGLWLFSYFADNAITVTNATTGAAVYRGSLGAGAGHELRPGNGLYRVHGAKGLSVMGGANACGADYSPAAGMFAVDDQMLRVIEQVKAARIEAAHMAGDTATPAVMAAPISPAEWKAYGAPARAEYKSMSVGEANERAAALGK